MTPGHHGIAPDDPPGSDRGAQQAVRAVGLGDDKKAGCLLVQPMDHSGPFGLALRGKPSPTPQQGVDECPAPIAGSRVHHHARRLVDDQQRVILVHDAYRNILAGDRPFLDCRNRNPDYFAYFRPVAGFLPPAIDQHVPQCDQGRRLGAGKLRPLGNKEVEADIAVRLDRKLSGFAQRLDLGLRI